MNANGWHYARGEKTFGPVDLKELQVVFSRISEPRNLLVWRAGFKGWERAGNVPELAQFIDKPPPLPQTSQPRKKWRLWRAALYGAIIIVLAILAGFVAGIIKELFPALHDVPTLQLIILTAFVVGIIILLFQRARGTLHDDHWAKDQFKNKEDKS
jgi:hypothetical protein